MSRIGWGRRRCALELEALLSGFHRDFIVSYAVYNELRPALRQVPLIKGYHAMLGMEFHLATSDKDRSRAFDEVAGTG